MIITTKGSEFKDVLHDILDSENCIFEILDVNEVSDPFETDFRLMNPDEWGFNLICHYSEICLDDGLISIFPSTFHMRKWISDVDEDPTFIAIGVGGTPASPEHFFLTRFYNINSQFMRLKDLEQYRQSCFRLDFIEHVIDSELIRIYSPY